MECPIGAEKCEEVKYGKGEKEVEGCPFSKDDGTGRMLCDHPYIRAVKVE